MQLCCGGYTVGTVIIELTQLNFKWNCQLELSLAKEKEHDDICPKCRPKKRKDGEEICKKEWDKLKSLDDSDLSKLRQKKEKEICSKTHVTFDQLGKKGETF